LDFHWVTTIFRHIGNYLPDRMQHSRDSLFLSAATRTSNLAKRNLYKISICFLSVAVTLTTIYLQN
jgi:hypothetical protein